MPNISYSATLRRLALMGATAFGLALAASSAQAQDYGPYGDGYRSAPPPEEIIVTAPRHREERSDVTGAPIRDVALSQPVRFDDLDLRTDWGAHALEERIRTAAHAMCRQLDIRYPISADNSPPCYSTAVADAMDQADAAIAQARAENDDGE
jgi:UrcA family protein